MLKIIFKKNNEKLKIQKSKMEKNDEQKFKRYLIKIIINKQKYIKY